MKLFYRLLFLFALLAGFSAVTRAQLGVDPNDSALIKKYADFDFNGKFAVLAEKSELNNFYLINLSLLPGRFDRIYFMNLMFQHAEVVNIDPEIGRPHIWFQSNKRYPEKEVLDVLNEVEQKTLSAVKSYTDAEKAKWLRENDKYK